jgi:hypothetical protein
MLNQLPDEAILIKFVIVQPPDKLTDMAIFINLQ